MIHLSVKIPEELYQQLETKTQETCLPYISDAVRVLLSAAVKKAELQNNDKIQSKILEHVVTSYYLLTEQLANAGDSGLKLNHTAHEKGKTAVNKILRLPIA